MKLKGIEENNFQVRENVSKHILPITRELSLSIRLTALDQCSNKALDNRLLLRMRGEAQLLAILEAFSRRGTYLGQRWAFLNNGGLSTFYPFMPYIIDGEDFSTSGSPSGYFPCRLDNALRGLHAISKPMLKCWAGSCSIHSVDRA